LKLVGNFEVSNFISARFDTQYEIDVIYVVTVHK